MLTRYLIGTQSRLVSPGTLCYTKQTAHWQPTVCSLWIWRTDSMKGTNLRFVPPAATMAVFFFVVVFFFCFRTNVTAHSDPSAPSGCSSCPAGPEWNDPCSCLSLEAASCAQRLDLTLALLSRCASNYGTVAGLHRSPSRKRETSHVLVQVKSLSLDAMFTNHAVGTATWVPTVLRRGE